MEPVQKGTAIACSLPPSGNPPLNQRLPTAIAQDVVRRRLRGSTGQGRAESRAPTNLSDEPGGASGPAAPETRQPRCPTQFGAGCHASTNGSSPEFSGTRGHAHGPPGVKHHITSSRGSARHFCSWTLVLLVCVEADPTKKEQI